MNDKTLKDLLAKLENQEQELDEKIRPLKKNIQEEEADFDKKMGSLHDLINSI